MKKAIIVAVVAACLLMGCDLAPVAEALEAAEDTLEPVAYQAYDSYTYKHKPVCWGYRAEYDNCGMLASLERYAEYDGFELVVPATEDEIEAFLAEPVVEEPLPVSPESSREYERPWVEEPTTIAEECETWMVDTREEDYGTPAVSQTCREDEIPWGEGPHDDGPTGFMPEEPF